MSNYGVIEDRDREVITRALNMAPLTKRRRLWCWKLYPPRGYTVLESYEYYSSHGGAASYLRALRNGGADYGGCG